MAARRMRTRPRGVTGWALVAIVLTFVGLAWSPKIRYATDVLGRKRARIAIAVGTVVMLPMLVGVWRAGA